MPRCTSSARILTGPVPRSARAAMKPDMKRRLLNRPFRSSRSRVSATTGGEKPRAASLRSSSRRLCSRRASNAIARRSHSAEASASGLERGTLRLFGRHLGGALLRQQLRADLRLDLLGDRRVLDQKLAHVLLALADAIPVVAVPGAGLLDDVLAHAEIDDLALARDALAVEDLELAHTERRRDLVLHHLHAGLVAEHLVALLDRADAAD